MPGGANQIDGGRSIPPSVKKQAASIMGKAFKGQPTLGSLPDTYGVAAPSYTPTKPQSSPTNNNGGGGGGYSGGGLGGGGIGSALAAFNQQKKEVTDSINGIKVGAGTAYEEAIKKLQGHYGEAAKDQGQSFVNSYGEIGDNLKNLGIDFASGDLAKTWDADQRNLRETADTALATDMAWFEKMKTTERSLYDTMLTELAKASMMTMGGGGGGGGRSGGGGRRRSGGGSGGGSSSGDISMTETTDYYNPLVAEELGRRGDPFLNLMYSAAGHNPTTASQNSAKSLLDLMNKVIPPAKKKKVNGNAFNLAQNVASVVKNKVGTANKKKKISQQQKAYDFFTPYTSGRSPQITKVSSSSKGKGRR